jgi:hypothetical protein
MKLNKTCRLTFFHFGELQKHTYWNGFRPPALSTSLPGNGAEILAAWLRLRLRLRLQGPSRGRTASSLCTVYMCASLSGLLSAYIATKTADPPPANQCPSFPPNPPPPPSTPLPPTQKAPITVHTAAHILRRRCLCCQLAEFSAAKIKSEQKR